MIMLRENRRNIYQYIQSNSDFLEQNKEKIEIYEGQLMDKIDAIMKASLDPVYYNSIKSRLVPINILPRVISKLAKAYSYGVNRSTLNESDQELIHHYEREYSLNQRMSVADSYAGLFKAYALEPLPNRLRVYPFDRFLVWSATNSNETFDVFIKMVGKKFIPRKNTHLEVYYTYSDNEFDAFDSDLETYDEALMFNEGINPYGEIPFVYAERSETKLIPTQNDDLVQITKSIAISLSDLAGALMYQCFTILYGIDLNLENLKLSPNAILQLSSDPKSDKTPSVGQINPTVDVDNVINFVMTNFSLWLETMGIKSGSIGNVDGSNASSGIAKIVDEMDTSEYVKKSQESFVKEEKAFWYLLKNLHNNWVSNQVINGLPMFSDDFDVTINFDKPEIVKTSKELIEETLLLLNNGFISKLSAMKNIFPKKSDEEIIEEIRLIEQERTIFIEENTDGDSENSN